MPGAAKYAKRSLVRRKTGPPKSPIGFLGRRKHNGAVSFSARKTMSGVCADDAVAVNFSVSAAIKFTSFLPSSHRRSACNVPTNGKIHITTALSEGNAHGQLCLRINSTNESATSVKFIKIRNRLIFSCYFNYRVPDSRNPLRVLFYIYPSSEVLRADVGYSRDTACRVRLPLPSGDSPSRGNVCEADKRVPVSGGKGGGEAVGEGYNSERSDQ